MCLFPEKSLQKSDAGSIDPAGRSGSLILGTGSDDEEK